MLLGFEVLVAPVLMFANGRFKLDFLALKADEILFEEIMMQNTTKTAFDELVELASDFVIRQGGVWDHSAWMDFISRVETRGVDVSEDMQAYLGELVEAIKQFHISIVSIEGTMLALDKLVSDSAKFITQQNGIWGPAEWVAYCRGVSKNTIYLSDEMMVYLAGLLESMKTCFCTTPSLLQVKTAVEANRPDKDKSEAVAKPATDET